MRVGKSGLLQCDFCGNLIQGLADSVTRGNQTRHYCQSSCLDAAFKEYYSGVVEREVERRTREEYTLLHKRVCAGCANRLRNLL